MKIHLYTNFTLGAGFCYAELTPRGVVSPDIPAVIKSEFVNGASNIVLNSVQEENISYLIVKGIIYVNKNKKIDDQGRKVFINFALETLYSERQKLQNIFKGLICEWDNVCNYLGQLFVIPFNDNDFNYNVDYSRFMRMLQKLQSYTDICGSDISNITSMFLQGNCIVVLKGDDKAYYEKMADDIMTREQKVIKGKRYIITETEYHKLTSSFEQKCDAQSFANDIELILANEESNEKGIPDVEQENCEEQTEPICLEEEHSESDNTHTEVVEGTTGESETTTDKSDIIIGMNKENAHVICARKGNKMLLYLTGAFVLGVVIGFILERILSSH